MNPQGRTMRLTVQQFLKVVPWQGGKTNQTLSTKESLIENKLGLTSSVKAFFRKNNWTGNNLTREINGDTSCLILSVNQFFQECPWESSKSIKNSTKKEQKPDWKVSDLSNLF